MISAVECMMIGFLIFFAIACAWDYCWKRKYEKMKKELEEKDDGYPR